MFTRNGSLPLQFPLITGSAVLRNTIPLVSLSHGTSRTFKSGNPHFSPLAHVQPPLGFFFHYEVTCMGVALFHVFLSAEKREPLLPFAPPFFYKPTSRKLPCKPFFALSSRKTPLQFCWAGQTTRATDHGTIPNLGDDKNTFRLTAPFFP